MSSTSSFMQTAVDAVKSKDIFKVSSCLTLFAALYPGQYNINEQDGKGHTLLYYALTEGTKEEGIVPESIALFLLQQGADGTLGETMAHSKITAVHLAVERKFLQVREKLIDKMPTISSVDDFTVGIYPYFMKVGLVKIFEHIEKIKSNKQAVLAFLRMKKVFIASIYIDGIRLGDFLRREFFAFISAQDLTTISIETAPSNAGDAEQNYFRMKCLLRGKMREVAVRNMPEQFLDFFHAIQNGNLQKVKDRKFNSGYLSVVGIITGARWQSFFDFACEAYNCAPSAERLQIIKELLTQAPHHQSKGQMLPSGDYEGEKTIQESIRSTGSNELIGDRLSRMSGGTQISRTDLSPMEKSGPRYVESEKKKFKQKLKYFDPKEGLGLTKQVSNIIKAVVLQDTASLREIDCSPQLMDCIWVNGMSILQFSQNEEINAILMAKGAKPKLQRIDTTSLDHLSFSCKINSQRYSVCCSNLFDNLYRLVKAIETHNASQIEGMDFPPEILSRVWFCSLGDLTFIHPKDPKLPGGFHLLYSIFCYSTEENKKKMVAVAKVLIEKYGEKEIQPLYQTKNSQDKMLTYGAFAIAIKLDSEKLFQLLLNNSRVVITESDIVFAEGHGKREWARRLRDRRDMPQCLPSASTALPMQVDTNLSPQELPSTSSASSMQVNTLKTNHSTKIFKVVAIPSRKKDSSREEYERNIEEKKKYIPEDVDAYLLNVGSVNDISSIVYRDGLSITGIIIHFQGRITLKAVCNMNFINLMDLMKGLTEINLLFQQTISQKLKEEIISQMKKKIQSRHRNMSINVIDQEQVDIRYDMGERKRRDGPYAQQRGATTALASSSGSVVAGESDQKDYMDEEDYEIMEVSPSASDLDSETDDDSSKKRRRDASHDGEDASHDSEDASHDGEDASHDGEDLPPALKRTKTSEAGDDSLGDRSCDGPWNGDDSSKKRRRDASHDGDDSAPGSSAGINTSADRPNSPNHLVSQIGIFSRVGAVAISGHDAAQIYPR